MSSAGKQGFRDFIVWQKSLELTKNIYRDLTNCQDYSYKDQIQRASISIMNNVAEGSGRKSDKAFCNFLSIVKGSASEVESMLLLGGELGYFDEVSQKRLLTQVDEVSRLLAGFMKKLKAQDS